MVIDWLRILLGKISERLLYDLRLLCSCGRRACHQAQRKALLDVHVWQVEYQMVKSVCKIPRSACRIYHWCIENLVRQYPYSSRPDLDLERSSGGQLKWENGHMEIGPKTAEHNSLDYQGQTRSV